MHRPLRRLVVSCLLVLVGVLWGAAANAGPNNLKEYCITGVGNGTAWNWGITDGPPFFAAQIAAAGVTAVGADTVVRDVFVGSINANSAPPRYHFAGPVHPTPASCAGAAFFIAGQAVHLLSVTGPAGPATIVGPSISRTFNPQIIQIPEPTGVMMLGAGISMLVILGRTRRR